MTIWRMRNSETLFSDSSSENLRVTKVVWDKTANLLLLFEAVVSNSEAPSGNFR